MGYTHYYSRRKTSPSGALLPKSLPKAVFQALGDDLRRIVAASAVPIGDAMGEGKPPRISGETIAFNGVGEEDAHESFFLTRTQEKNARSYEAHLSEFMFTKTARKPYDEVVTAFLIALHDRANTWMQITSDGQPHDWREGLHLATRALGRPLRIPEGVACDPEETDDARRAQGLAQAHAVEAEVVAPLVQALATAQALETQLYAEGPDGSASPARPRSPRI